MKHSFICILVICVNIIYSSAQTLTRDQKIDAAIRDAEKFKLNKVDLAKFRQDRNNYRPRPTSLDHRPSFSGIVKHGPPDISYLQKMRAKVDTIDYYAPWFMPTKETTGDITLLSDSTYVQYYRAVAYQKTKSRHTAGHYFAIGGIIVGGVAVVAGIVIGFLALINLVDSISDAFGN